MSNPNFDTIRMAVKAALAGVGVHGEMQFVMDGMASTSWIGPPGGDDLLISVSVTPLDDDKSPVASPVGTPPHP